MKKYITLAGVNLFIIGIIGVLFWSERYEYIKWNVSQDLDASRIYEIDINCIDDLCFNIERTTRLARTAYGVTLPINDPKKIEKVINSINNCEIIANPTDRDTGDMIFFKMSNNVVYYLRIGWDNDKIYGKSWESNELYELLQQWRQEKIDLYNKSHPRREPEKENQEDNPENPSLSKSQCSNIK